MEYDFEIREMKRVWAALEKQLLEFNEIIPFERNPHDVYSPKLVNMMLIMGPQIEAMAKILVNKLKLTPKKPGILGHLQEINKDGVLSMQRIISLTNSLLFTPFPLKSTWWDAYNITKHELSEKILEIRYQNIMDSLAALSALHRIYDTLAKNPKLGKEILDKKNWQNPTRETFDEDDEIVIQEVEWNDTWTSQLFKITTYFHYVTKT